MADYYYKEYLNQEEEKEEELLKESLKYYKIAARNQHVEAQYKLFEIYSNGEIIEKDNQEAIKWLKESAEQGYAEAQNDLGIYCRDESKFGKKLAFGWFEQAARQGYAEAQTNVGECYKEGLGVERNTQRAFYWFNEAANKGEVPNQFSADAYDVIYAMQLAANDAGITPDMSNEDISAAMSASMLNIELDGLTGKAKWTEDGECDKEPKAFEIKDGAYVEMQ